MTAAAAVPVATAAAIMAHAGSKTGLAGRSTPSSFSSGLSFSSGSSSSPATNSTKHSAKAATVARSKPTATSSPAPAATATKTPPLATQTVSGPVVYDQFGGVQATVTVRGKKIMAVQIAAPMNDPRSASINSQAVPLLRSETLQAQSAAINLVSGATLTSEAYQQSLQAALSRAGI
jgi:uncharacterized protein with FMN-binding domain